MFLYVYFMCLCSSTTFQLFCNKNKMQFFMDNKAKKVEK